MALFYQGPGEYLSAVSSVVEAARIDGNAHFIAVPEHKIPLVRGMLGDGSANVTLVDMTELGRNPARIIPALLTYAREHPGQHAPGFHRKPAAESQ